MNAYSATQGLFGFLKELESHILHADYMRKRAAYLGEVYLKDLEGSFVDKFV